MSTNARLIILERYAMAVKNLSITGCHIVCGYGYEQRHLIQNS